MDIRTALAVAGVLMCIPGFGVSSAEMYKWVDKFGITHIRDSPPQDRPSSRTGERRRIPRDRDSNPASQQAFPKSRSADEPAIKTNPTVELYTTSWCPHCKRAREYLNRRGIAYTDHDVEKDKDALRRSNELAHNCGVPVAVIDGQVVCGFSEKTYDSIFGRRQ